MSEPDDARSIIDAAEQAAAAGDFASAGRLLREAARLQELRLGAFHPDLANTLNNLGIVCEMTGNASDAEQYFRRACTIATAVLPPDHPFVVTSRKNLQDFCEARGKPAELPTPPDAVVAGAAAATSKDEPLRIEAPAVRVEPAAALPQPGEPQGAPPARRSSIRPLVMGAIGAGALGIAVLAVTRPWASTDRVSSPTPAAIDPPQQSAAPVVERPPAVSAPPPAPIEISASTATAAAPVAEPVVNANASAPGVAGPVRPTLARANLCAALDSWRCTPPDDPAGPGPLFFYTQIKSSASTTVRHQWYRENVLQQSIQLRVQANPGDGFRTFSRLTLQDDRGGNWRVELRAEDGTLLHEERFSVR
jgi:hypothetical protein